MPLLMRIASLWGALFQSLTSKFASEAPMLPAPDPRRCACGAEVSALAQGEPVCMACFHKKLDLFRGVREIMAGPEPKVSMQRMSIGYMFHIRNERGFIEVTGVVPADANGLPLPYAGQETH